MNYLRKRWEAFLALLKEGVTPHKIALGIAGGIVIGTFPLIGPTTFLCFLYAWLARVNAGIVQFANYATYPLQIICLLPLYKTGAYLSGTNLSEETFTKINSFSTLMDFIRQSGILIYYTIGAWMIYGSIAGLILYLATYLIAIKMTATFKTRKIADAG